MTDEEVREEIARRTHCRIEVMSGSRVFRGSRITVQNIGEMARSGVPLQEILEDYPKLDAEDIELARRFVELEPESKPALDARLRIVWFAPAEELSSR